MHAVVSPPLGWYEPADILDDEDEPAPAPVEPLVIAFGAVIWTATDDDTDLR